MAGIPNPISASDAFRRFLGQARSLLRAVDATAPTQAFREFVRRTTPIAIADVKGSLPFLAVQIPKVARWLIPASDDLLATAGLSYAENPYIELVKWSLAPASHPPTALRRQRCWLKRLGMETITAAAEPRSQFVTDDGIPDLVLQYSSFVVVVEAKTGTAEHAAPSGEFQTKAYAAAVQRKLCLSSECPVKIVFLTPDGDEAENPDAKSTTFVDLVDALSAELDPAELPVPTRAAFMMLFSHLLRWAAPNGEDYAESATGIGNWIGLAGVDVPDSAIIARLPDLLRMSRLIRGRPS